ncbi:M81 family metallopeptidase [Paenibacillus sp. MBLB4367]|uniref:M81 family metallopeptidase n=1 Tax=Paenibacillus sp. MBLB4367 TaxID=3384767 RepID=UPI003908348A
MSAMKRIGVIGVIHETNSYAPGTTELDQFQFEWVLGKEAYYARYRGARTSMGGAIDGAEKCGLELVPGFYTAAVPSGMVSAQTAEAIMQNMLDAIDSRLDGLLVILHGAMVSETFMDVEGEVLKRIREKVGAGFPVAVTLDLHANISPLMVEKSDIIVGYDTYPHVDAYERAIEAVEIMAKQIRGEIKPVMALSQPRLMVPPQGMVTDEGAMKELMDLAFAFEKEPHVLNITVAGGFPYSDVPDAGFAFVVLTDGDAGGAQRIADALGDFTWENRDRFFVTGFTPEEAVSQGERHPEGPVILIEGSDNVGGGAPADATHLLPALLKSPAKSLIVIRDENAAQLAHRLGVGSRFSAAVGGKAGTLSGSPVPIDGTIRLLADGNYRHVGRYMTGQWAEMGLTAVVETGNVTVVLTEKRVAPWDAGHVQSIGITPADYQMIVVKSAVAWKTAFGDIAKAELYVDSPGCCSFSLQHFTYEHVNRPLYPLDPSDAVR